MYILPFFLCLCLFFLISPSHAEFDVRNANPAELECQREKLTRKRKMKSPEEQKAIDEALFAINQLQFQRTEKAFELYRKSKEKRQFLKQGELASTLHKELEVLLNPQEVEKRASLEPQVSGSLPLNAWLLGAGDRKLPVVIFQKIAALSRNRSALRETCKTLRDFPYACRLCLTLPYHFFDTEQGIKIREGIPPFPWAHSVEEMNLFQIRERYHMRIKRHVDPIYNRDAIFLAMVDSVSRFPKIFQLSLLEKFVTQIAQNDLKGLKIKTIPKLGRIKYEVQRPNVL